MLDYFVKQKNYLILIFTVAYLAVFTVNAFIASNFEFLYYTVLMTVLIYLVVVMNKRLHLAFFILVNLSLLGFLHLLGGNFYFYETRLYDFFFVPGVIRYDNIVHTYGTFIATLALYSLLADFIDGRIRQRYFIFALILVLMAIGIGTLNELGEFLAVLFFGAAEEVGGYFNNALDLFFNTLGSILATIVIYIYRERPRLIQEINEKIRKNN
ncbi:MAG: hypothetical protein A3J62_03890 [Candidatus Buchananbacteria bacterium RIFCSPHIGHO2_02_FULL_38_8]|uniref:DUF2238 domain-containing protein n=2 Tax=Candidatus Buchananiibacteriota TaxID=1817903 RepID=A0A1G1XZ52_9BACT|nr:MAG: hypothetical protein A2731_01845 [Candidatus Buchananbacteria bacterium RIFCSPHIGHO2_01_FULL_39_8]OGY47837.1 MAG: hypothetical protein A3J62_03890 [Candidatus Buchananbacteria bacterium RIFCSPHIGHO2_02_FULL_38_8]